MRKPTIMFNNDGHEGFYFGMYAEPDGIEKSIAIFHGTGVHILEWCVNMGSKVNFLSDHFELFGRGERVDLAAARRGDRIIAETLDTYARKGIDPLGIAVRKARDVGVSLFPSIRMNQDYPSGWMGDWVPNNYNDSLYFDTPHVRIRNRDGSFHYKRSYAYQEYRDRILLLIKELLNYPVDGISLDYVRHSIFVGYDAPLVEAFRQQHGFDPHDVPEDDERWIACKCGVMTSFMRQVRELAGNRPISARVDRRYYRQYGLDIAAWADEGLIDYLIVAEEFEYGGYTFDLAPFVAMTRGKCQLIFGEEAVCSGHDLSADEDKAIASGNKVITARTKMGILDYTGRLEQFLAEGADGVHIFNDPFHFELAYALHRFVQAERS
ncbi:family 10 glycosylhydrolase [Paenibacillus cymbidii]|uniref:family 10 glycosylhydrolase n=1 Tax=Paenibacillus cymbidii TaxID=1639034 RepID=UPI0010803E4D|nr:family 10 glycosylhydrolase [Paenibacillus cymbidii]